jgi:hypothetical protein
MVLVVRTGEVIRRPRACGAAAADLDAFRGLPGEEAHEEREGREREDDEHTRHPRLRVRARQW